MILRSVNNMKLTSFVALVVALTRGENCDNLGVKLYEDLACTPSSYHDNCPASYSCDLKPPQNDQCLVQGTVYNNGVPIPRSRIGYSCEFGCFCKLPRVNCAQWGCSDWTGNPPVGEGCHRTYSLESCCSTGTACPPFNDSTTCTMDGVVYKARERFFPESSCHVCVCRSGFKGKLRAPFCKRVACDVQVKYQAQIRIPCAPVYLNPGKKCCPNEWTCPDGSEVIKQGAGKSDLVCKFGETVLQVGDSFEKEIWTKDGPLRIGCACKIPPLLICEKK